MTAKEAVNEITKVPKYYTYTKPPMKQSTASRTVAAINAGTCKPATEQQFLKAFGYDSEQEAQYRKGEKECTTL